MTVVLLYTRDIDRCTGVTQADILCFNTNLHIYGSDGCTSVTKSEYLQEAGILFYRCDSGAYIIHIKCVQSFVKPVSDKDLVCCIL